MTDDLSARRWQKTQSPDGHKPREALAAILRDIDEGRLNPKHVIVAYTEDTNVGPDSGDGRTGFYQAGDIGGYFGAMGLLTRVLQIMGGNP